MKCDQDNSMLSVGFRGQRRYRLLRPTRPDHVSTQVYEIDIV